jgi:TPR repeat protein
MWFRKAAAHGSAKAQVSMAQRHLDGEDVKKDVPRGLKYLRAAENVRLGPAQLRVVQKRMRPDS